MVKSDRLNYIPMDLSTKEWQPVIIVLVNPLSINYHPSNDIHKLTVYKPPIFPTKDFHSNDFSNDNGDETNVKDAT